jgi:HTH-type transcriptional regulator / antitoxin HipB
MLENLMRVYSMADVSASVRGRRLELGLSQSELARRCGVSRKWISQFEAGKASAEFALVLRVIDEVGLTIELTDTGGSEVTARREGTPITNADHAADHQSWDLDEVLEEYRRG